MEWTVNKLRKKINYGARRVCGLCIKMVPGIIRGFFHGEIRTMLIIHGCRRLCCSKPEWRQWNLFSEIYHRTPGYSVTGGMSWKLQKLWEGLGYYNRVRNMQEAAKTIKMNIMADCLIRPFVVKGDKEVIQPVPLSIAYQRKGSGCRRECTACDFQNYREYGRHQPILCPENRTAGFADHALRLSRSFNQALMELNCDMWFPNWIQTNLYKISS